MSRSTQQAYALVDLVQGSPKAWQEQLASFRHYHPFSGPLEKRSAKLILKLFDLV
jgi:hypothetical protein